MGGVDLLQKAEDQEKLLEESNTELQLRKTQQEELRKQIENKEVKFLCSRFNCDFFEYFFFVGRKARY